MNSPRAVLSLIAVAATLVTAAPVSAQGAPPIVSTGVDDRYAPQPASMTMASLHVVGDGPVQRVRLVPLPAYGNLGTRECQTPCTLAVPVGSYRLMVARRSMAIIAAPGTQTYHSMPDGNPLVWSIPLEVGIVGTFVGQVMMLVGWAMTDPICIDLSLFGSSNCSGSPPQHPVADNVILAGGVITLVGLGGIAAGLITRWAVHGGIERVDGPTVVPTVSASAGAALLGLAGTY